MSAPVAAIGSLLRQRNLLLSLVSRELKARYRGSALGFLWSLVNPLLLVGVFTLVFGRFLSRPGSGSVQPYALFLVTGLFPWIWANASLLEGTVSLSVNAGLIRKAVFPIGVLPLVAVLSNLVHFVLALPILFGALAVGRWLDYPVLGWHAALLPVVVALELVTLAGVATGLSVLHVHFKDVRDLLANVLQLLFFLTPILYPLTVLEWRWARVLVMLNPFTPFTLAYQSLLFFDRPPAAWSWLEMSLLAVLAWIGGSWLESRLADSVVEAV